MPQTKQAKKYLKQSLKRENRNKVIRDSLKTLLKKCRKAVASKDPKAKELIQEIIKKTDKAAQKGIIKKNTASRKKSRLIKSYNKSKVS